MFELGCTIFCVVTFLVIRFIVRERKIALFQHELKNAEIEDLSRKNEILRVLAYRCSLTLIPNRAAFDTNVRPKDNGSSFRRDGQTSVFIWIDIDHFKFINDTFGHPIGDFVLSQVADRIRSIFRRDDDEIFRVYAENDVFRMGGEEFLIVATIDQAEASQFCERVRKIIADSPIISEASSHKVTVSLGYAFLNDCSIDTCITRADTALYRAKKAGRNCWRGYDHAIDAISKAA